MRREHRVLVQEGRRKKIEDKNKEGDCSAKAYIFIAPPNPSQA
jgi:hypothetical protein